MCPFIPSWIAKEYQYEIRNYSVIKDFSRYHSGFSKEHINSSLEFLNREYISVGCHGWNHSEELNNANLSYAYNIVNYTLWNWYNNYNITPNFWLGHNSHGNYNISLALKSFSEKYWTVYAEYFSTKREDLFPGNISPAVDFIGPTFDPFFGCTFGHPCKSLEEAQYLFSEYSQDKEIIFIRGHPAMLNDSKYNHYLNLWQKFIDWIYTEHTFININHTQAIEYKIDRNNFLVEKIAENNFIIDLSECQFNHNILFSPVDTKTYEWILKDDNWNEISIVHDNMFLLLQKNNIYHLIGNRLLNT